MKHTIEFTELPLIIAGTTVAGSYLIGEADVEDGEVIEVRLAADAQGKADVTLKYVHMHADNNAWFDALAISIKHYCSDQIAECEAYSTHRRNDRLVERNRMLEDA